MKFLLAMIVTIMFSYFLRKSIKKHAKYYYIGALMISFVTVFISSSMLPAPVDIIMTTFFRYGTIATAMLSLVMYMNAFTNGTVIQKTFMPIRAELSIIACILTYGHNLYTGKNYVAMFLSTPEKMSFLTILALFMSVILIVIMTPLFITSFKCIRKKMKPKNWKKLQQSAYVFYMLIYVHIMILMLPVALNGNMTYIINVVVYSIVFLLYATLRLYKYYHKSKKKSAVILIIAMYLCLITVLIASLIDVNKEEISKGVEEENMIEEKEDIETENIILYNEEDVEASSTSDIELSSIPDGTYTGTADGFNGPVTVTVTITSGVIDKITLDEYVDDEEYMNSATSIRKKIIEEQCVDVDVVTGATYSSNGIKNAVLDALTNQE